MLSGRQTAERELRQECSAEGTLWTHWLGHAPIGHFKYDYPADFANKSGFKGAKVASAVLRTADGWRDRCSSNTRFTYTVM